MNEDQLKESLRHFLFDFDAEADARNTSKVPDYSSDSGFVADGQDNLSAMTEEGWRSNVDARINVAQTMCQVTAEAMKELQEEVRSLKAKVYSLTSSSGGAKF